MTRPASCKFTKAQRLEVFETFGAIVCCQAAGCDNAIYIAGCHIDHHLALIDGGKHELPNWRPICTSCHRKKSANEHRNNAKAKRVAAKHSGQEQKPTRRLQGRKFAAGSRPWPESQRKIPSRPFPKPYKPEVAE